MIYVSTQITKLMKAIPQTGIKYLFFPFDQQSQKSWKLPHLILECKVFHLSIFLKRRSLLTCFCQPDNAFTCIYTILIEIFSGQLVGWIGCMIAVPMVTIFKFLYKKSTLKNMVLSCLSWYSIHTCFYFG